VDKHLTLDVLGEYFDGLAAADQVRFIEAHLADCDLCADLASRLFANSELLDQWTAKDAKAAVGTRKHRVLDRVLQAVGW
jgi:predicted anti-sigma-YlaC factor YlaD